MNELAVHPSVYATGESRGLISILERIWVREQTPGDGTFYIVSGFANYNGGVRFFPVFRNHIDQGGRVVAFFGGHASQRLTSRQVVEECLECGVEVYVVNRKRLMHVKSYGSRTEIGERLVVTSGNFTGPGMSQNVEMSVLLDQPTTRDIGFSWDVLMQKMVSQRWNIHEPSLGDVEAPVWSLLYDEEAGALVLDDTEEVTMVLVLGHSDTARVMSAPMTDAAKGTQYFWLSKDCYGFFPALTVRNRRGWKATYSAVITVDFVNLAQVHDCRVTFEAENNLDFRLGTGPLRHSRLARSGDVAAISRIGEQRYELRLYRNDCGEHGLLSLHAVNHIGHRGKRYGFLSNDEFQELIGARVGRG